MICKRSACNLAYKVFVYSVHVQAAQRKHYIFLLLPFSLVIYCCLERCLIVRACFLVADAEFCFAAVYKQKQNVVRDLAVYLCQYFPVAFFFLEIQFKYFKFLYALAFRNIHCTGRKFIFPYNLFYIINK